MAHLLRCGFDQFGLGICQTHFSKLFSSFEIRFNVQHEKRYSPKLCHEGGNKKKRQLDALVKKSNVNVYFLLKDYFIL